MNEFKFHSSTVIEAEQNIVISRLLWISDTYNSKPSNLLQNLKIVQQAELIALKKMDNNIKSDSYKTMPKTNVQLLFNNHSKNSCRTILKEGELGRHFAVL